MDKYLYMPAKFGKILEEDGDNFRYEYIRETENEDGVCHEFDWQWAGLKGFAYITMKNDTIISGMSTIGTKDESPV